MGLVKLNRILAVLEFFLFSFKSLYILFLSLFCFFAFVTILKSIDGFSKGAICVIPNTLSSNQNHYQKNIYAICELKLFSI